MNDLLSRTFSKGEDSPYDDIELGSRVADKNLNDFFAEVNGIKKDMEDIRQLQDRIKAAHEESKTVHKASNMKDLRKKMEKDVNDVLRRVKVIKTRLENLDKANMESRTLANCEPGSSTDRTRMATTNSLRTSLKSMMNDFQALREMIRAEYHETVERRYYTVTGQKADEETIERIIEAGEGESLVQKAIQEQGRGQIMDVVKEIQERHDAVRDIESSLNELHQVFLDMSVLVQQQGDQLDSIEAHVGKASSFVERGGRKLLQARKLQKNTRKWTCLAIIILLIIILIIILPIVLKK